MGRRRKIRLEFYVSEKELHMIQQKMAQIGTNNLSAYLRKIAIDGCIIKLVLPELRDMQKSLLDYVREEALWDRRLNGCFDYSLVFAEDIFAAMIVCDHHPAGFHRLTGSVVR